MDPIATHVARRFRAELLTKQWLMGVRRGWLHLMETLKPNGWPAIFKAFDTVREFADNLEEQVKYVRRGPYSSHSTMSEGEELDALFKKLKNAIAEKRSSATHWYNVDNQKPGFGDGGFTKDQGEQMRKLYEEKFGELLTAYVPTKVNPAKGQWNKTREAHLTEFLDKILDLLRKDAARLQKSIETEKEQLGESPTEETFKDPVFKEFSLGRMKVIVTDPKGNGHYIRPYVRLLDIAHQLTSKKGFGQLWYGTLMLQSSSDYKQLSESEQAMYERAGYHDIQSTAGEFHSGADVVVITAPADDRTIKTIIHELGHRYWFKFMGQSQRLRFKDLMRLEQKPLLSTPIKREVIEEARRKILAIGNDRKQLLKDFEDDFRASADSAEVEKHIKEYAPKFKAMVLDKDPIFTEMQKVFAPAIYGANPQEQRLMDAVYPVYQRYTGKEDSAEVKFRRHMLPESFEGAWKRGMSDGLNQWLREAFKLHFEMEDAALEYLNHVGKLGERKLDPDESKVMPVSEYGKTNPEEAFAEVFAHYVLNQDMTRDQSESFQSVLKKTAAEKPDSVTEYVTGFFKRHPHLQRFAPAKIIGKEGGGAGSHPEARQAGNSIQIFPKFWKLDAKTRDFVLAHELGHYVLSNYGLAKLIEGLQARGVDPWESQNLPFGQTNMDEAFADSFATHFLNRAELQRRYPEWAAEVAAIINR